MDSLLCHITYLLLPSKLCINSVNDPNAINIFSVMRVNIEIQTYKSSPFFFTYNAPLSNVRLNIFLYVVPTLFCVPVTKCRKSVTFLGLYPGGTAFILYYPLLCCSYYASFERNVLFISFLDIRVPEGFLIRDVCFWLTLNVIFEVEIIGNFPKTSNVARSCVVNVGVYTQTLKGLLHVYWVSRELSTAHGLKG